MLTPTELSGKEFEKSLLHGYHTQGVDDFMEIVTRDYSELFDENAKLKRKIKILVEKLEEYRSTEDAMRAALLTAQKQSQDMLDAANRKSAEIIDAANRKSVEISARMDADARMRMSEFEDMQAAAEHKLRATQEQTTAFTAAIRAVMRKHEEFLRSLEDVVDVVKPSAYDDAAERYADAVADDYDYAEPTAAATPQDETLEYAPRSRYDYDNLQFGINYTQSQ